LTTPSDSPVAPLARFDAAWIFNLYPDAGEGSGSFQSSVRRVPAHVSRGAAADPERSALEAGRRARQRLRRYCAANRLNRLGTLTYRDTGNHNPELLRQHLGEFFRALRASLGGDPFPYAWVPEWHKSGHGLHAHFAVGQYIKRSLIERAWPHGFVHIKLIGDLPVGTTSLGQARRAASYLSKYVAKAFVDDPHRTLGLHRYDIAQGFTPRPIVFRASSEFEALATATELLDEDLVHAWFSHENPEWAAPPAVWAQWGR
jgi:hypothetical protein